MSGPIYQTPNTEGRVNGPVVRLVAFVRLPDRRDTVTGEPLPLQQRQLMLDGDIRDAMAQAARKLSERAASYHTRGYVENLDDITYDMAHLGEGLKRDAVPTLVASLVIRRPT